MQSGSEAHPCAAGQVSSALFAAWVCNDYQVWHRYTSIARYAEECRIAVVTFSCHNKAYLNAPLGENFYDFLNEELPEFVEQYFPISTKPEERYIAGLSRAVMARCCTAEKSAALQRHVRSRLESPMARKTAPIESCASTYMK